MRRLLAYFVLHIAIAIGVYASVTETFDDETIFPPFGLGGISSTVHSGSFGTWSLYDGNGMPVYGITDIQFENSGAPSAWRPYNATKTNPPHENGKSHSGQQCMISFCPIENHVPATADHWLVSPELSGNPQTISFFVRQLTTQYGNEKYEVLAYPDSNGSPDFGIVGTTREIEGEDWQEVSVDLPAGTRYFAIRHISYDIFAMMIDDITYEPKGAPIGLAINETIFPDPAFRSWLKEQSYGSDGFISVEELNTIYVLNVNNKGIKTLKGIEYFSELAKLSCYQNQLTTLDLSKNTKLIYLMCDQNQLAELDLTNNELLIEVQCWGNQLTKLTLPNSAQLKNLICDMNNLTSLDVTKNTALTDLSCQGNNLTSLDVTKNTALKNLFCEYNSLSSLDLSNNAALKKLYCNTNQLSTLDLSKNTALEVLYCFCNQIRGAGMDALIASMPSGGVIMRVIYNKQENNVMTKAQVAAAKAKGVTPYYYDGTEWKEYAGSDDPSGDGTLFYYYANEDGTLTITHAGDRWHGPEGNQHLGTCHSYTGDIVIPEEIGGKKVTAIGKDAFYRCDITSVVLANTLKLIDDKAFLECPNVKELTIPASVDSIGNYAFNGWDALEQVTIEDSPNVLHAGRGGSSVMSSMFSDQLLLKKAYMGRNHICPTVGASMDYEINLFARSHVEEITFGDYVTEIQKHELLGCKSLKKVNLSKNITSIGDIAFDGCELLSEISIPDGVESIGYRAFNDCQVMPTLKLSSKLKTIGAEAFRRCFAITSFAIPGSVQTLGKNAFSECNGVMSLTLEDSSSALQMHTLEFDNLRNLTKFYIGRNYIAEYNWYGNAFSNHPTLAEATVAGDATEVSNQMFNGCKVLKKVKLGDNITRIGIDAFHGCDILDDINLPESLTEIGNRAFCRCFALKNIQMPYGLKSIGEEAFTECPIVTIHIPATVETITSGAFSNCSQIRDIYCYGTIPPVCSGWLFGGVSLSNMTLYYPEGERDAYKAAVCWKEFFDDHVAEINTTGINNINAGISEDAVLYDLQGRRRSQLQMPGLYIRNGKKIVIK